MSKEAMSGGEAESEPSSGASSGGVLSGTEAKIRKHTEALTKALGNPFKPKDEEPRNKYLARLVRTADKKLSDEQWASLSPEAQQWVNDGNKAINESKPVAEPAGASASDEDDDDDDEEELDGAEEDDDDEDGEEAEVEASDDEDGDDDDDDENEEDSAAEVAASADDDDDDDEGKESKVKTKTKKVKKARPEKAAKKASTNGRVRATEKGAADAFCKLVLKHPDESLSALMERFEKSGDKIHNARAASVRRSTLRVLRCQA